MLLEKFKYFLNQENIYQRLLLGFFDNTEKYLHENRLTFLPTSPNTTRVKWSLDGSLITFYGGSSVVVWAVESEVRKEMG